MRTEPWQTEEAVGFSTNRLPQHPLSDARFIPGTFADRDRILQSALAIGRGPTTWPVRSFYRGRVREMTVVRPWTEIHPGVGVSIQ